MKFLRTTILLVIAITVSKTAFCRNYETEIQKLNQGITDISQFKCPNLNITFEVKPVYGSIRIDYTKTKDEINKLQSAKSAKSNSPLKPLVTANSKLEVHGLAEITDAYRVLFPHQVVMMSFILGKKNYTKYCLIADKITYELGAKEINIRIPSEYYFTNGCVQKAILEHENTHVKIFRTTLSKYAKLTYTEGQKILKQYIRPRAKDTSSAAENESKVMLEQIRKIINKYSDQMHKESEKLNNQFDIDDYNRNVLKLKCGFDPNSVLKRKKKTVKRNNRQKQ